MTVIIRMAVIILLLTPAALPRAAFCAGKAGATGAQVLEIGPSARAGAMGSAFTAVVDDGYGIFYNPAGLAKVTGTEIPLGSNQRFGGLAHQFFGVAYDMHDVRSANLAGLGTIAAGFTNLDKGDMPGRDAAGLFTGNFSAKDSVVTVGYGRTLVQDKAAGKLMAGVTGKYFEERIGGEKFQSQAFDAGALWENAPGDLSLGLAVMNMGSPVHYVREDFSLPLHVRMGGAVRALERALTLSLDYDTPAKGEAGVQLGGEYWFNETIALRAGYDARNALGSGLTAGFGFSLSQVDAFFFFARQIMIDYAFVQSNDVDSMHLLSVMLKMGAE